MDSRRLAPGATLCAARNRSDIKPENFLIDELGHLRLCDFGFVAPLGPDGTVTSLVSVGTPQYMAPEVLTAVQHNRPYTVACDWWSIGILGYELLFGFTPFQAPSVMKTYALLRDHQRTFRLPAAPVASDRMRDLLHRLCAPVASRLRTVADLRQHAAMRAVDWGALDAGPSAGAPAPPLSLTPRSSPRPGPPADWLQPAPPVPRRADAADAVAALPTRVESLRLATGRPPRGPPVFLPSACTSPVDERAAPPRPNTALGATARPLPIHAVAAAVDAAVPPARERAITASALSSSAPTTRKAGIWQRFTGAK